MNATPDRPLELVRSEDQKFDLRQIVSTPSHVDAQLPTTTSCTTERNLPSPCTPPQVISRQKLRLVRTLDALDELESQPMPYRCNRRQGGLSGSTVLVLLIASAFFALAAIQWLRPSAPHVRPTVWDALEGKR